MKNALYIFFLASFCWACSSQKPNDQSNNIPPKDDLKVLEGNWVMSNYLDSIKKYKAIERFTTAPLALTAIVLKVSQDSIFSYGLLNTYKKDKLFAKYDSLLTMKHWHQYQLSYDKAKDQLKAVFVEGIKGTKDRVQYTFRRIAPNESQLVAGIEKDKWGISVVFYRFFIEELISGTYKPLTQNTQVAMKLDTAGKVTGFKQYNKYHIHDYFMTNHPYRPEDAIIFKDTTAIQKSVGPPTNIGVYSWAFRQDTLVLTEMVTETYEQWTKGKKTFKFIKQ